MIQPFPSPLHPESRRETSYRRAPSRRLRFITLAMFALLALLAGSLRLEAGTGRGNSGKRKTPARASAAPARKAPAGLDTDPPAFAYDPPVSKTYKLASGDTLYVSQDARHDATPVAWRDLPDVPARERKEEREHPSFPLGLHLRPTTDPVIQNWIGGKDTRVVAAMPAPAFNFAGQGNANGYPPDTNGSVGPNHYVQTINTSVSMWTLNRATGTATQAAGFPKTINALWSGFGGACDSHNDGDPIVLYDKTADRWLVSQFTSSADSAGRYYQCVAISQSPDPTGAYNRYAFANPSNVLGDYPHFGIWPDGYYFSENQFGTSTYAGGGFVALDRTRMLAGQAATQQFITKASESSMLPADVDGSTQPAAGAPEVFVSLDIGGTKQFSVWKMHVDWSNPGNTTLTGPTALTPAGFNVAGNATQPGGSQLDTLSDRLLYRLAYRRFSDHESLVVNHAVDAGGGVIGTRWYELRLSGPSAAPCTSYPCVYQQGTYAPADGRSRWMGSVAMDSQGNMMLGLSAAGSGSGQFPSVVVTGRLAADPAGQMAQGETTVVAGSSAQSGISRWGDYASMSIDPTDDCTFWFTTLYSGNRSTRVSAHKFAGCGGGTSTWAISGTVTDSTGAAISAATVTTGGVSATTSTSGTYTLSGLANGTYTLTPAKTGYTFTPVNRSVTVSGANITGQNFTGSTGTTVYSISGSAGTASAVISYSGAGSGSTTADASGNYSIGNLAAGTYSVSPAKSGCTFTPASLSVTLGPNATGKNFTASCGGTGATPLSKGVAANSTTNSTAANSDYKDFTLAVPSGASSLVINTTSAGDVDLYVKFGATPSLTVYDCRPYTASGAETCNIAAPSTGTYYIRVYGWQTGAVSFSVKGDWTTGGGTPVERMLNGSYEGGTANWTLAGTSSITTAGSYPHGGTSYGFLCINANSATGSLTQTVTIPSTATTATLSFWLNIVTQESPTTPTAYDIMTVKFFSGTLATYSNVNNSDNGNTAGTYVKRTIDVSGYRGQTLQLNFSCSSDGALPTVFRVDDVSLLTQ